MKNLIVWIVLFSSTIKVSFGQKHQCDSLIYGDTQLISRINKDNPNLVLIYKTQRVIIKVPLKDLLKETKWLKMSQSQIKNKARDIKSNQVEEKETNYLFFRHARSMACNFLYYRKCYIEVDGEPIKKYRAFTFRNKSCNQFSRYILKGNDYIERSVSIE